MPTGPFGAAVIVQPSKRAESVNVAPASGIVSVNVYGFVLVTDNFHLPYVSLVVIVAFVPVTVQPLIFGGFARVIDKGLPFGIFAEPEKLVQLTVTASPSMSPSKTIFVPDFSAAVTFVPAGSVFGLVAVLAELTAADARTNATTPTAAIKVFMCADFIILSYPLGLDVLRLDVLLCLLAYIPNCSGLTAFLAVKLVLSGSFRSE
jgi:hypothetical protein